MQEAILGMLVGRLMSSRLAWIQLLLIRVWVRMCNIAKILNEGCKFDCSKCLRSELFGIPLAASLDPLSHLLAEDNKMYM